MDIERFTILPAGTYFFGDPGCVFDTIPTTSLSGDDWDRYTGNDFEDIDGISICDFGTAVTPLTVAYGETTEDCDGEYRDTECRYEFQVFYGQFGLVNLDQAKKHLPDLDIPSLSPAYGHVFTSAGPVILRAPEDNVFSVEYDGSVIEVHTTNEDQ